MHGIGVPLITLCSPFSPSAVGEQGGEGTEESGSALNLRVQREMNRWSWVMLWANPNPKARNLHCAGFSSIASFPSNQQLMRTNKCQCNSSLERWISIILPLGMRWNCSISRLFIFPTFKYSYEYFWKFSFSHCLEWKIGKGIWC